MMRAVFLDRDGVINDKGKNDFVYKPEMLVLYKNASKAIKILNGLKLLVVVVTNQPAVARGLCSENDIIKINNKMKQGLAKEDAKIDAIYFCPHHPDKGYPEENTKYKINCNCRKPKIGMIEQAKKDFHIEIEESFFVGDQTIDIQTGKNAGCKTILVKTGNAGNDKKFGSLPDFVCKDILDAALLIKRLLK